MHKDTHPRLLAIAYIAEMIQLISSSFDIAMIDKY